MNDTYLKYNSYNYTSNYGYERFFPTESAYINGITGILQNGIGIISIPKTLFGDYINPNTFRYKFKYDGSKLGFCNKSFVIPLIISSVENLE